MRIILFIIIWGAIGCSNRQTISEEQYKDALHKIHQCEAYHELKMASNQLPFLESCKSQVLKDLNISKGDFDKTTQYYISKPKEFEALYDSILLKYP